jgi:hypothetical protein
MEEFTAARQRAARQSPRSRSKTPVWPATRGAGKRPAEQGYQDRTSRAPRFRNRFGRHIEDAQRERRTRAWREKPWAKVEDRDTSPRSARFDAEQHRAMAASLESFLQRAELEGTFVTEADRAKLLKEAHEHRETADDLAAWADQAERAATDYMKNLQDTGFGIDKHGLGPNMEERLTRSENFWKSGRTLTTKEWRAYGYQDRWGRDMLLQTKAEWDAQRKPTVLAEDATYYGPKIPARIAEAKRQLQRVRDHFPAWMQERVRAAGGKQLFTSGPCPRAIHKGTQESYLKAVAGRETDRAIDRMSGYYSPAQRFTIQQIGGPGNSAAGVELHEFGHMVDYLLGPDPGNYKTLSGEPEFLDILEGLKPFLGEYYKKPVELFAEGISQYVEREEVRTLWRHDAAPQWRRLARYFDRVLQQPGTEGALLEKAAVMRLLIRRGKLEKGGTTMEKTPKKTPALREYGPAITGTATDADGNHLIADFYPDDVEIHAREDDSGDDE